MKIDKHIMSFIFFLGGAVFVVGAIIEGPREPCAGMMAILCLVFANAIRWGIKE